MALAGSRGSSQNHINYGLLCYAPLLKLNLLCPSKDFSLDCIPFWPVNPTATGVKLWYPNKSRKCTHSCPSLYTHVLFSFTAGARETAFRWDSGGITSMTLIWPRPSRSLSSNGRAVHLSTQTHSWDVKRERSPYIPVFPDIYEEGVSHFRHVNNGKVFTWDIFFCEGAEWLDFVWMGLDF